MDSQICRRLPFILYFLFQGSVNEAGQILLITAIYKSMKAFHKGQVNMDVWGRGYWITCCIFLSDVTVITRITSIPSVYYFRSGKFPFL